MADPAFNRLQAALVKLDEATYSLNEALNTDARNKQPSDAKLVELQTRIREDRDALMFLINRRQG